MRPEASSRALVRCAAVTPGRRALWVVVALLLSAGCTGTSAPASRAAAPTSPPAAASAPAAAPAARPAPTKMIVAFGALSTNYVPVWVTKEQGFFEKYGIDAELTYMDGSVTDRALATGDTPIAATGAGLVPARLAGADVTIVATIAARLVYAVYVQPDVTSVESLRGRTLVTTTPGSSNYQGVQVFLKRFGMEFGRDVEVLNSPGGTEQLAILRQGLAQGALFTPPSSIRAREIGLRELLGLVQENIPFATSSIGVNRPYAERNPEVVKNLLRAYGEGLRLTHAEPAVAKEALATYARLDDPAALEESYNFTLPSWPRSVPYPNTAAIQTLLDLQETPEARAAKMEDFADARYLRELDESGFFRQIGMP